MGWFSFGKVQPAGKWLLSPGDNSLQFPIRKCPAGTVPCISFTLTSPELYFIFNLYKNTKRRLKWGRTRESRIQTKLHRVFLSPQNWQPAVWTSPSCPRIAIRFILHHLILSNSETSSCSSKTKAWKFVTSTDSKQQLLFRYHFSSGAKKRA